MHFNSLFLLSSVDLISIYTSHFATHGKKSFFVSTQNYREIDHFYIAGDSDRDFWKFIWDAVCYLVPHAFPTVFGRISVSWPTVRHTLVSEMYILRDWNFSIFWKNTSWKYQLKNTSKKYAKITVEKVKTFWISRKNGGRGDSMILTFHIIWNHGPYMGMPPLSRGQGPCDTNGL